MAHSRQHVRHVSTSKLAAQIEHAGLAAPHVAKPHLDSIVIMQILIFFCVSVIVAL
jgi:hypothetical protein